MEKPNITEGEWELRYDNPLTVSVKTTARPASNSIAGIWREEDAKAISAVPDMIDALIKAYKNGSYEDEGYKYLIESALKKAGVQL